MEYSRYVCISKQPIAFKYSLTCRWGIDSLSSWWKSSSSGMIYRSYWSRKIKKTTNKRSDYIWFYSSIISYHHSYSCIFIICLFYINIIFHMSYILLVLWLVALIKGADYLVDGSSSLAKKYGISNAVIWLTIVAFWTSMPELIVNILWALQWSSSIAFGNIIGSNIANILLILWVTGLISNLKVQEPTIWKEIPFSLLAVIVLLIFANMNFIDGLEISTLLRSGGLLLISFFVIFLYYAYESAQHQIIQHDNDDISTLPWWETTLFIIGGLTALYFWGTRTVDGATEIAKQLWLSDFLISVTVIAIGTSLPELVTSVIAARKNNIDMAVGNIIGSNIFNIFWILWVTALIQPLDFPTWANVDMAVISLATVLLFIFMFIGKRHHLDKRQSLMFILIYIAYMVYVIMRW